MTEKTRLHAVKKEAMACFSGACDNGMDAAAVTHDCQEHIADAKGHDQTHDAWLDRLEDHLRGKNDQAGLVILQKVRGADAKEDAHIYDQGVEYKLVKLRGFVAKISRFGENGIKLLRSRGGRTAA